MSETLQPVLACIGLTNSVHEYCRFAIMIIAINDAMSWNQRLCNRMTRLLDPDSAVHLYCVVVSGFSRTVTGPPEGGHEVRMKSARVSVERARSVAQLQARFIS